MTFFNRNILFFTSLGKHFYISDFCEIKNWFFISFQKISRSLINFSKFSYNLIRFPPPATHFFHHFSLLFKTPFLFQKFSFTAIKLRLTMKNKYTRKRQEQDDNWANEWGLLPLLDLILHYESHCLTVNRFFYHFFSFVCASLIKLVY